MSFVLYKRVLFTVAFLAVSQLYSNTLLTGNGFKQLCRFWFDTDGFSENPKGQAGYYFVKTDLLEQFLDSHFPTAPFVLVTHNADHGVTEKFQSLLDHPLLIAWYGQNLAISHPKLHPLPIGISNLSPQIWYRSALKKAPEKDLLIYANYAVSTNPKERGSCLAYTKIAQAPCVSRSGFLSMLSRAYFVLSPEGNGIDCHRTWESLYFKAIPIVTKSPGIEEFAKKVPMIVLSSWEEFPSIHLSKELYKALWGEFDPFSLKREDFIDLHLLD